MGEKINTMQPQCSQGQTREVHSRAGPWEEFCVSSLAGEKALTAEQMVKRLQLLPSAIA